MQRRHGEPARVFARFASASAVLLALAAILVPTPPASAAPAGALSMNPANNALAIGDTVAITFDVSGGVDLHRVAIGVTYNQSVVQAVDADAGTGGTQILPGSFPGTDLEGAVLQNSVSAGIINYQYELDGSAEVSGDGTIATVQFLAVANGNANGRGDRRRLRTYQHTRTDRHAAAHRYAGCKRDTGIDRNARCD